MIEITKNKLMEFFWILHCKGYISFNLFKKLFYKESTSEGISTDIFTTKKLFY